MQSLAALDLRLLTVTAVINSMVEESSRRKGNVANGPIDWEFYMNEQSSIVQRQEEEAVSRKNSKPPSSPDHKIEHADYPAGATIFGGV